MRDDESAAAPTTASPQAHDASVRDAHTASEPDATMRVAALEADIVELHESTHAFKLVHEKHVAELNAKDVLLARKSERIDELAAQLRARDALLEAERQTHASLASRIEQLEHELSDASEQLTKDEDDFAMVAAALAAKEQVVATHAQELAAAQDAEARVRKELDRSLVIIRRLEKSVEALQPETADACVSPRSFRENQLIALRDDAIAAKTREVWLLSGQNDQLRVELDDLEAAMAQLQTLVMTKDNDLVRQQRRIAKLELALEAMQASQRQAEGRERAMEIATTQNHKLLLALAAQERASDELTEQVARLERECADLRSAYTASLEAAAASDVDVLHRTKAAEERSATVRSLQDKLQRERRALQTELAQARLKFQVETEAMQSELVMRRTKQYELTLKLQDADARLHDVDDALERTREQLGATTSRMDELERVLQESLQWKHALEAQLATQRTEAASEREVQSQQLRAAQSESATLKALVAELQTALAKVTNRSQRLEHDVRDAKQLVESRDALVREQRERIARLVAEVTREAQTRAERELEHHALHEQLEALQTQTASALRDADAQTRRVEDKCRGLRDTLERAEREVRSERAARAKLVVLFADAFAAAAAAGGNAASAWTSAECLDLRDCALRDQDLPPLLRMLEHAPPALTRVDLRANRITQDGMRALAAFSKKLVAWLTLSADGSGDERHCHVRDLDLRQNCVTLDGVRVVASCLETLISSAANRPSMSTSASIKSVVVTSGGRIECYRDAKAEQLPPVLTVDISANFDTDVVVADARRAQQHPHRRRSREADGSASTSGNNASAAVTQRDQLLLEAYGADLVSTLVVSASISDSAGLASVTPARRKASSSSSSATSAASPIGVVSSPVLRDKPKPLGLSLLSDSASLSRTSAATTTTTASGNNSSGSGTHSARLLGSSSLPKLSSSS